jgi:hypothetical protein
LTVSGDFLVLADYVMANDGEHLMKMFRHLAVR